jgi:RluA family pseudouridine synthase
MIPVLYQDADCVAVMKPCGVASVPERAGDDTCLSALLARQLASRVFPVHRLDKEVSGVLLYAFTADAHRFLNTAFEQRNVRKTYLAVVHGTVGEDSGVIRRPLREFGSGRIGVDDAKGKPSETRFEVVQRNGRFSLVRLHPLTGRRHQLRAHLYSIGHPIAGDDRYGAPALRQGHPRLMLTATGISLELPSGRTLDLHGLIPDDFREAARACYGFAL